MKRRGFLIGLLVAVALSATAWGFEPYFSDAAGNKLGQVWEGQQVYIAVKDPDKGACGIAEFTADLVIFDFKTGAYVEEADVVFRELGGIGSGLYFWVTAAGSNSKVAVQVGSRADFTTIPGGMTHVLGEVGGAFVWAEGAWEYVDENVLDGDPVTAPVVVNTGVAALPRERLTARVDFEGLVGGVNVLPAAIVGRLENNDTLVLIVADNTDERNIDQDQVKIVDTTVKLTVTPAQVAYGCGPACGDIIVKIEDPDENLNCNQIEYVPFFVIVNPGSWNPQTSSINNFCSLMLRGSVEDATGDLNEPIRWYNIYDEPVSATVSGGTVNSRWIRYPDAWLNGTFTVAGTEVGRALFFAAETAVDSGVFEYNFGNLDQLQAALGFSTFTPGTTIAFYYIDPNDFDDMWLATIVVGDRAHSQVFITDANGIPVDTVKIGWGGLYVRVYDADANVEACCQDKVVVHICDPHNEDDSEYYIIDEVSNDSGIFFTQAGIPLDPVWDAVGGYQLVFDDWRIQAFNEDTIFVRYNSVDYEPADLNALGDGNANTGFFPPRINTGASRNQPWDVSFDLVKVYDFQVFDGTTHRMRFLNGSYQPVTEIPLSGSLYLEVTDLDQNENPLLRELIFGGWNKDTDATPEGSNPIWFAGTGTSGDYLTPDGAVSGGVTLDSTSITAIPATVKVFMWNAQRGTWERIDLRETAVGSGVFRSTTCVLVADARNPGDGNLASKPGDTIMAFYQDPSNHSDISIISIKVSEGGAGGITPPPVALSVAFDRTTYYPGDTVTITVTDDQYAGAGKIVGATKVLVLKDKDGAELASWTEISEVAGQPGKFRVTYVLPQTVKLGTITAVYTDPIIATRTAQASATVAAAALTNVTGISITPNPFATSTTFTIVAQPTGAVADKLTITIYDLTGHKVGEVSGTNTGSVTWTGGTLRNGAYIYVAVVEGGSPTKVWTFRGFVYIKR